MGATNVYSDRQKWSRQCHNAGKKNITRLIIFLSSSTCNRPSCTCSQLFVTVGSDVNGNSTRNLTQETSCIGKNKPVLRFIRRWAVFFPANNPIQQHGLQDNNKTVFLTTQASSQNIGLTLPCERLARDEIISFAGRRGRGGVACFSRIRPAEEGQSNHAAIQVPLHRRRRTKCFQYSQCFKRVTYTIVTSRRRLPILPPDVVIPSETRGVSRFDWCNWCDRCG